MNINLDSLSIVKLIFSSSIAILVFQLILVLVFMLFSGN